MAHLHYDQQNTKPLEDFEPVPAGDYKMIVSEVADDEAHKPNKLGLYGRYSRIKLKILEGSFKNQTASFFYYYDNVSDKQKDFCNRMLQGLITASGRNITDTVQLINTIVTVKLSVDGSYNKVDRFIPATVGGQITGTIETSPQTPQQKIVYESENPAPQNQTGNPVPSWEI